MHIRELSPSLAKKAKEELFENPTRIEEDLKAIKEWIAKQPHLHARTDDQWLVTFLRGSKFSLERTKKKLDLFYTMKTIAPELTMSMDPLEPFVQEILSLGILVLLPKTVKPDDPIVFIMKFGKVDPKKYSMIEVMRVIQMIGSYLMMENDQSCVAGSRVVIDCSDATLSHWTGFSPTLMKKLNMIGQDASPGRQKGTHYINIPSNFQTLIDMGKPFMNEKTKSRLFFHNSLDDLYRVIPKSILPTEYGGEAGPIQDMIDDVKKKVESYRDWYLDDMQYKTDETKRTGEPKTSESLFGIEGSFRQLEFD